jgi:tetratricopeptide (TPR) repeat protein
MHQIREAEGYLELLTALDGGWQPRIDSRHTLARRALATLDRIENAGGQWADILFLRGEALRLLERFNDAIPTLEEAADLDPDHLHTWLALATCYKRSGRLDMAIQSLEEALAIDINASLVYYKLACNWSLAGNAPLAIQYLSAAIDLDDDYRELVHAESDFDPIRQQPEFKLITSVIV